MHLFIAIYYEQKCTLTLRIDGGEELCIKCEVRHKKNPLLDQLEIIAEVIPYLLADKDKKHLSDSEKRMLGHIRRSTREIGGHKVSKTSKVV